jgi:hypothetical protein
MTFDEETLIAYADGELDAATRAALEAAAASDPQLAARIARQRALRARLEAAFAPVLAEPVPERLLASTRGAVPLPGASNVVRLEPRARPRWSWPEWSAIAASLVLGALLGPLLSGPQAGNGPVDTRTGQMLASGVLARALSEQLASAQPPGAPVEIGVSFSDKDGGYCRTFVLRERQALAGLACRAGSAWQVVTLVRSGTPAANGYRQAASALPPAVAGTLDELIAGAPLDAAGEAAARARGWNPAAR